MTSPFLVIHIRWSIRRSVWLAAWLMVFGMVLTMSPLPATAGALDDLLRPRCDPSLQLNCIPGEPTATSGVPKSLTGLPFPPPDAPGSCGPGYAGAPLCGAGPATLGNKSGTNQGGGNPINIITGNKYQREDDMSALPGVLGLEIVRHYNSAYSNAITTPGLLGRGWKLSYETDLYAVGNTVQIIQADGTRIIFNRDAANASLCSSSSLADGTIRIDATSRGDEYVWHWANGRELSFNHLGKLVQIADPTGEFVSLQHDHQGLLVQVTDPQGRQLRLQYPHRSTTTGESEYFGVIAIDSPVGRFEYAYGSALPRDSSASPKSVAANLVKVVYPHKSGNRLYHYEDARRPTFLTGISVVDVSGVNVGAVNVNVNADTDKSSRTSSRSSTPTPSRTTSQPQRIGTYLYDINGKAILTVKGNPARLQLDKRGKPLVPARLEASTGIGQVTLDYATPGRTVMHNSLGQTTIYRHAIIDNQYRLLEVRGAGCSQCGEANVRYGYDNSARLTETIRLNAAGEPISAIRVELDDAGRQTRESTVAYIDGKAQAPHWRAKYSYPAPGVLLVSRPSVVPGREMQIRTTSNVKGQVLSVQESGWSPNLGAPDKFDEITRTTTYHYRIVNGRSVLAEIDGPLANGASNSPRDSDITRFTWDDQGSFVMQLTQPGGGSNQMTYDEAGQVESVRNERALASRYTYHRLGMLQSMTQYDAQGKIVTEYSVVHDTMGHAIEFGNGIPGTPNYQARQRRAFDAADQLLWQANSDGVLRQAYYDPESHLTQVIVDGAGQRQEQRYRYDTHGRIVQVADGSGAIQRIGNANAATSAGNNVVRDDFGREIAVTTAGHGRTVQAYDAADRLMNRIDANGVRTSLRYDVQGHLSERRVQESGNATSAAVVTTWHYVAGRLTEVRIPGQSERFEYDADGRQISNTVELDTSGTIGTENRVANSKVSSGASPVKSKALSTVLSTNRTRYQADTGIASNTLPDGSWLHYERDRQGQIVALSRQTAAWSLWGANRTTLMSGLQRDLIGLRHATYGNGIQANWQRSAEGAVLARVVYTMPSTMPTAPTMPAPAAPAHTATPLLPGALGLPTDLHALFDVRLIYDAAGNVLLQNQNGTGIQRTQAYAYDGWNQLIAAQRSDTSKLPRPSPMPKQSDGDQVWRYAYDADANRVLAQEKVAPDEMGRTRYARYDGKNEQSLVAEKPAAGKTSALTDATIPLTYFWNALGQLQRIEKMGQELARYQYDARGLRVSKVTKAGTRHYLYDQSRQRIADLDAQGRLLRQYVWMGDKLIATIDPAEPREMVTPAEGVVQQALQSAQVAWRSLIGQADRITYIHANHLGAPIAATDAQGRIVWQADYAPYGKLIEANTSNPTVTSRGYQLDLRLPGQWEDAESGLYYNDARYYDPETGRYLTADPLGHLAEQLGSTNAFGYVNNNPTSYVDPLGLILFAFDGTGNSDNLNDPAMKGNGFSNIRRFLNAYDDGRRRYVSGVGTVHRDSIYGDIVPDTYAKNTALALVTPSTPLFYNDMGGNYSGPARINRMVQYMEDEANAAIDTDIMQIDIIGFSRGAAQAREFANRIVSQTKNGTFNYIGADGKPKCQMVNFRFMGLFDTVLSTNYSSLKTYRLGIPDQFVHVAQAVALNEYRSDSIFAWDLRNPQPYSQHYGGFPLESIGASSNAAGKVRIEQGFIGAHADIGGGYAESEAQLSLVALNWMSRQAQDAGVKLNTSIIPSLPIANPVLHDQSYAIFLNKPDKAENSGFGRIGRPISAEDRIVNGAVSGHLQRTMGFGNDSMRYTDTQPFIGYQLRDIMQLRNGSALDPKTFGNKTGTVNMQGYLAWLRQHDYCFIGDTNDNCKHSEVKQ